MMIAERRPVRAKPDAPSRPGDPEPADPTPEQFIGTSSQSRDILALVERVAPTDSTVLVRGPSGVGKELIARAVHRQSGRSRRPFIVVDCTSLHENLLLSELFGHERGAFTGAVALKRGLFEVADGSTIFLDEIAEMTPALQVKLLRIIECGTFRRVGGTADIRVDVRVIAATNRDLEAMLGAGSFREDLYYRLNVFTITLPPLVDRMEDVPLLADYFMRRSPLAGKRHVRLGPAAADCLVRYSWPGNARELANVIERALILCDGEVILPTHLPASVRVPGTVGNAAAILPDLETVEFDHIRRVLDLCHGHRQRAARVLRISERNLYRLLKKTALEGAPKEGPGHAGTPTSDVLH